MYRIAPSLLSPLVLVATTPVIAWVHAGSASIGGGGYRFASTTHAGIYGGVSERSYASVSTTHISAAGARSTGAYGVSHTTYTTAHGTTAYHSTYSGAAVYPGYHPPTTVNYYGSSCYNCGGWSSAGAAAAGVALGAAAGAAIASSNTAAATANAHYAGVAAGSANTAFAIGAIYATPPAGAVVTNVRGQTYYLGGSTWFMPSYGANGVYYRVVAAPQDSRVTWPPGCSRSRWRQ